CAPFRRIPSRTRPRPGSRSRPKIPRKAASTTCAAPRKAMSAGRRERGFTLVGMLIAVAALGGGLAAYAELASHAAQREKEQEPLSVGNQMRQAIGAYYERSPGAARRFPEKLEDLLEDKRYPMPQRYLRQLYADPMTGKPDWVLVAAPAGGIMGVHSAS